MLLEVAKEVLEVLGDQAVDDQGEEEVAFPAVVCLAVVAVVWESLVLLSALVVSDCHHHALVSPPSKGPPTLLDKTKKRLL